MDHIITQKSIKQTNNLMTMMDASFRGPRPNTRDFHAVQQMLRDSFLHSEKLKLLLEDADAQIQQASVFYTRLRLQHLYPAQNGVSHSPSEPSLVIESSDDLGLFGDLEDAKRTL